MAEPGADRRTLLIYGDTERNASLRHELPLSIVDPLLFAIVDGEVPNAVRAQEALVRDAVERVRGCDPPGHQQPRAARE